MKRPFSLCFGIAIGLDASGGSLELAELKRHLQEHFSDGLVTIVGSGVSTSLGLPSMKDLAVHLLEHVTEEIGTDQKDEWNKVSALLRSDKGLESSLKDIPVDSPIIPIVTKLTADLILKKEKQVTERVLSGDLSLPLSGLLKHVTFNNERHAIITTNYDRLVELAAETSDIAVDSFYLGKTIGIFDPKASKNEVGILKAAHSRGSAPVKVDRKRHIVLLKPHGSVDWFDKGGIPMRCSIQIDAPRLMIVPGGNKYRRGYDKPFDLHREEANKAIDGAARFLVLGYGFNDDHLETHLRGAIQRGVPCLAITRTMTPSTAGLVSHNKNVTVVCSKEESGEFGTQVIVSGQSIFVPDLKLWDLGVFIKEILQ